MSEVAAGVKITYSQTTDHFTVSLHVPGIPSFIAEAEKLSSAFFQIATHLQIAESEE